MSKLERLTEWYTIPKALEIINIVEKSNISESDLYQLALQGNIVLSLLIHDKLIDTLPMVMGNDYAIREYYNIQDQFTTINTDDNDDEYYRVWKQYVRFHHHEDILYNVKNYQEEIFGIWDIISIHKEYIPPSPLLRYIYNKSTNPLFTDTWKIQPFYLRSLNKHIISCVYPLINAHVYPRQERDQPPLYPSATQLPKETTLIIRKENLDSFINMFNQNINDQANEKIKLPTTNKPLNTTEKENLLRVLAIFIAYNKELGDISTTLKYPLANILIEIGSKYNIDLPSENTIVKFIDGAKTFIPTK